MNVTEEEKATLSDVFNQAIECLDEKQMVMWLCYSYGYLGEIARQHYPNYDSLVQALSRQLDKYRAVSKKNKV